MNFSTERPLRTREPQSHWPLVPPQYAERQPLCSSTSSPHWAGRSAQQPLPQDETPARNRAGTSVIWLVVLFSCLFGGSTCEPLPAGPPALQGLKCLQTEPFQDALTAYLDVGNDLTADRTDRVKTLAEAAHAALTRLKSHAHCTNEAHLRLDELARAARAMASLQTPADIRLQYGRWSQSLMEVLQQVPPSEQRFHVFHCTMAEGYGKWLQTEPQLRNPYMGTEMPSCGAELEWSTLHTDDPQHASTPLPSPSETSHYVCPMHPSVQSHAPGDCPLCGMDLVPVTHQELREGAFYVDTLRRRSAGIHTTRVERGPMRKAIRTLGTVNVDTTRLQDVVLRFSGFVEKVWVAERGIWVRRGQPLFSVYSPELYAAQKELLEAVKSSSSATLSSVAQAARNRLRLVGLTDVQIDELLTRKAPLEHLTWFAPISGYVLAHDVVQGARVEMGQTLYRMAPLDRVWVEAEIHEDDIPFVQIGTKALLRPAFQLGNPAEPVLEVPVSYLSPDLHPTRRTRTARVVVPSPNLEWLPGTSVEVRFEVELGVQLQIPKSAVVHSGPRQIVFVDEDNGRLRPKQIQTGAANIEFYEVRAGLEEGERVVSAGTFLVAAESRLRDATGLWNEAPPLPPGRDVQHGHAPAGPSTGGGAP